jgi:hypothetical protein
LTIDRRRRLIGNVLSSTSSFCDLGFETMSARGELVSNPNQKSAKRLSESKSFIPLLWLSFLSAYDFDSEGGENGLFILKRKDSIDRAKSHLDFLVDIFDDFNTFENDATSFLARLSRLKSNTIGINVADLAFSAPPNPSLSTAVNAIEARNRSFSLSIPARTEINPFSGDPVELQAKTIASTREMLLGVCSLSLREILHATNEERTLYTVGCLDYVA